MPHVGDVVEGRGSGDKGPTESRRERGRKIIDYYGKARINTKNSTESS